MDYRDSNEGWWKFALGAAAVGVIALAFRGTLRRRSAAPDEGEGRDLRFGAGRRGFHAPGGAHAETRNATEEARIGSAPPLFVAGSAGPHPRSFLAAPSPDNA